MRKILAAGVFFIAAMTVGKAFAQQADQDAATLYLRAAGLFTVDCPSTSNDIFPDQPPYSPAWIKTEKAAFDSDQPALALVHLAALLKEANWPDGLDPLNRVRMVAEHVGDAILYLDLQGNDAGAFEKADDLLQMANSIEKSAKPTAVKLLVAAGIRALTANRVMIVASDVQLTTDPANPVDLQVNTALQLIPKLLDQTRPEESLKQVRSTIPAEWKKSDPSSRRAIQTFNRVNAECSLAAMSLGCHLFLFEQHRWPNSAAELAPNYLPQIPLDPWGDGKQTLGYVLIKGGLPDGSDRPLIYSRCNSADGLFFATDQTEYGFYNHLHGTKKQGGQFRDVVRWTAINAPHGPTTRALP